MLRLALFCLSAQGSLGDILHAEGNPHTRDTIASCCPAQALPPDTLLDSAAARIRRQEDTFVRARRRAHLGRPVEVLTFRQPARLSHLELPFDLALVADVDPSGIVEVDTPPAAAADSWFPDYTWSHFVVCTAAGGGAPRHLGWRYARKIGATGGGPESFVALIVRAEESEAEALLAAAQAKAAEGEGIGIPKSSEGAGGTEDLLPPTTASLLVGVEAPSWMATMLAAVTARRVRS